MERTILPTESDILYMEGRRNYTLFYLIDGTTRLECRTMNYYDKMYSCMIRVHRSHSVNLNHIERVIGTVLVMKNGKFLPVSRRKLNYFLKSIDFK